MTSCRNFRRSSHLPEYGVGVFNFFFVSDEKVSSLDDDPAIAIIVVGSSGLVLVSVSIGSSSLNSGVL